jgi:hypothetical protein
VRGTSWCRPGRGYQLVADTRFPTPAQVPHNLPFPPSELIGRETELDKIARLFQKHRLVTLTGAGGIGKTRLGLEAATRLFPLHAAEGTSLAKRRKNRVRLRFMLPDSTKGFLIATGAYTATGGRIVTDHEYENRHRERGMEEPSEQAGTGIEEHADRRADDLDCEHARRDPGL